MALSACKVPIDDGLRSDMEALKSRMATFEALVAMDGFQQIDNQAQYFNSAMEIDEAAREAVQHATDLYDELNLAVGEAIPG